MELGVCILRLFVIILLSVAVESEYEYSFLHPPETSRCQDPGPVPNAYRHFNQNGDVIYSCYYGYKMTSGSSQLTCTEGQYSRTAPVCTLVCGTPASYVDQTVNYTDNIGGSVAKYACMSDYSSSNNTLAICNVFTGRWTYSPLACFKKLKLSAMTLPNAVDQNVSTCESLTNFHGHWSIGVGLQNATLVDVYRILMNIRDVSPTGAVLNITVSKTGQNSVFKLRNILQQNTDLDLIYDEVILPWGTNVSFFTNANQLSLCEVEIFGRPFSGTCPSPPAEPRLKMTSNLTTFGGVFELGHRVYYECDDHLYYAGGGSWSECMIHSVWSTPQLTCSDDTNFAATVGSVIRIGTLEDEPDLHDDNSSTCVPLDPTNAGGTYTFVVTLNYTVEVHYVTVTTSGSKVTCATNVTTLQGNVKTCVPVTSDVPQTFVMSCPLYLGVTQVHVNISSDSAASQSAVANICEIRVLGANYTDKVLECVRTPHGNDYRGILKYTEEGLLCLHWDEIHPELPPSIFPDNSLQDAENFCRNPVTYDKVRPWCYISSTETGYCPVISCDNFFKTRRDSATYRGTLIKTASGEPCIPWTTTGLPAWHSHSFSDDTISAAGSTCRNPGASQTTAWCYVSALATATATAAAAATANATANATTTAAYKPCDIPDPAELLTVYEEPVAQKMALSVCLQSDGTDTRPLMDVADSIRRPCSSQTTRPVRLCIHDTGIAAVRIWCAEDFCAEPAPVANAYRSNDQTGLPGSKVSYTCYYGYRLTSGDLQRTCMKYGQYSGNPPVCTLDCRLLPTAEILLDNVTDSLSNISAEIFGVNDSSIFCDPTSGQWELRNGSEVNVSTCPSPPAIPRLRIVNETIVNSTYMVGDNVTYACAKGFYVQGGLATSTCGSYFQFRMDSKLICSDEENKAYSTGRYIFYETQGVQLLPILMDDRDDTCQTFSSSDLSFTLVFWRELEVRLVTMTFAGETAISRIAVNIESRSNKTKECNGTDAEQVLVGGVTVLIVSCVSMPVGKAVNINISLSTQRASLCEIRAFGRKYDGALGCTQTAEGYDYKGHVSTQESGEWCSLWANHYLAHNVSLKDELFIFPDTEATDLHDFCRRPTQSFEWVGCYSSGGRGNCNVSLCSSDCTLDAPLARDYTGTIDTTMKELKCIPWDSPGLPFLRKEDFPDGNMSHAYCRNPGASQSKPWCYTNATTLDFGYCAVPECKPTCQEPAPVANAYRSYRSNYVGTSVSYTCYHGYDNTAGSLSRVCQSNGMYSGDAPVCEFSACLWENVATLAGRNTTVGCGSASLPTAVCDPGARRLVTLSCPGVCFDAPAMPRLQINVTLTTNDPQTTRYDCAEGFYPVGGNATVRCLPSGDWENVTLQCEGWTNYGLYAAPVAENREDVLNVIDDNTDTCNEVCSPLRLDLRDDLEVNLVTLHFASSAVHPVLQVEVETSQGTRKGCSQSDVYDVMTVVTCTQAPVGKALHVTFTKLSNCSKLCEVRIFGRPFSSGKLLLIQEKMNFWSATKRCRNEGGDLLSVHDSQTQDMAFSLCRKAATLCWVGLYQGLYYEWTDNSVVDYKTHEWNNTADGRCLAINQNSWQNRQCNESLFSVCNVTHHNTSGAISLSYSDALECLQWPEGREYKGNINFTKSGYSCLRWDMLAVTGNVSLKDFPDEGLEEAGNKCRNPLGLNRTQPWCFVNGTGKEWEYCNIPYCSDICQIKGGRVEFSGPVSRINDSLICAPWSTTRFINPEDFPKGKEDLKNNYCRNPTNSQTQPWCYTNSNGSTYQHCDIPECSSTVLFYKETDLYTPYTEKCIGPENVFYDLITARPKYQQLCLTTEELSLTILCYTKNHYFVAIQIQCDLCPDLPLFSSVSLQTGVYKVGTSWTYTCAEGLYPVSGSGTYTCHSTKQWIPPNPVLLCKNWINYAHGASLDTASTSLTDDNINTCTDFPAYTYQLQMTTELEISIVTFVLNQTQTFSGLVTVTSANMTKACSDVTVYGTLVVVTCKQAPVTRSLTLAVNAGAVLNLCEWRVFGRPATPDGDFDFLECLQSERGTEYKGDVSFTRLGVTCLRWDSINGTSAFDFPDWNLMEAADKCRNPGNSETSPWCHVNTTGGPKPQLCFIPKCSKWCDVANGTTDYSGYVDYSPNSPCSKWSQVLANQTVQLFRGEDFPDKSTNHKFCRNPNNSPTGSWCYTDLTGISQSCSVPHCPTTLVSINESDPLLDTVTSCFLDTGVEASYSYVRATASARCPILSVMYVTVLCKTNTSHLAAVQIECDHCPSLPIASGLVVEQRKYAPGTNVSFTCSDTRVPVGGPGTLLCSLSLQWEVVSRDLQCEDWLNYGNLLVTSVTKENSSANLIQLVDSNVTTCVALTAGRHFLTLSGTLEVAVVTFHFKEYSSNVLPLAVTVGMTNASGEKACTALSNGIVSVFRCQQGPVGNKVAVDLPACTLCEWGVYGRTISSGASNALQCLQSPAGAEYKGDVNFTHTGVTCLRWDAKLLTNPSQNDLPDSSVAEAGNKCRNPVSQLKERPWCYVNGGSQDWEYCWIPSCEAACWIQNGVTSYHGTVSVASNNKPCVSWKNALANEAVPSLWPWDFPDLSTDHNFCRNPNNSQTGPWCYTDLAGTSQTCSIPHCPTELLAYYEDDPYTPSVNWCYTAVGPATLKNVSRTYQSTCLTTQQPFLTALCANNNSFITVEIPCQLPSSWSSNAMSSAASTIFSDYASTPFDVASSSLVGEYTVRPSSALSLVTHEPFTEPAAGYTATSTVDYTSTVETSTNSHHFDPITSVTTRSYHEPGSTFAATPILTNAYTYIPITTITSTPTTAATSTPTTAATSTPTTAATSTPITSPTSTPTSAATSTPTTAATSTPITSATSIPTTAATSTPASAATSGTTGTMPSDESFGRRQAICPCKCALRQVMKNMSEVQALVTQQQKELTVDKYALSSTRRLKASEPNHDIYAVATGSVLGVTAVTLIVLFFVMSDLVVFSIFLRRMCRRWSQRWRRR